MTLRNRIISEERRPILKKLLAKNSFARAIEVHNGISAIIGNDINIENEGTKLEFDALWISSLTDSAAKGYPDIEIVSLDSRIDTINQVMEVTTKPIIVDGDTGGDLNTFEYFVKKLERHGVSAVIIEDKVHPKRNSLDPNSIQNLEDPVIFANKIKRGKNVQLTKDFMIIARLESLISGEDINHALKRARIYLEAGADGIMIHSKSKLPNEVILFAREYKKLCQELNLKKPLICVPTTYNIIKENELRDEGFNIIIHANHLLRSSHKAMINTAKTILENERSLEVDPHCSSVHEIFETVGFNEIKKKDDEELEKQNLKVKVIIPAAGEPSEEIKKSFPIPVSSIKIGEKTILERQIKELKECKLKDFVVIKGYKKELINTPGITYYETDNIKRNSIAKTVFTAENEMEHGFILIYSDVLFEKKIIQELLKMEGDIVLVVDESFIINNENIDKKPDYVITKNKKNIRELKNQNNFVIKIGQKINREIADYEFTGIALFSKKGVENLKKVYLDCLKNQEGEFHEADNIGEASITDLIQEMANRGYEIKTMEIHKGWMEIHNLKDYSKATTELNNQI